MKNKSFLIVTFFLDFEKCNTNFKLIIKINNSEVRSN